LQYFFTLFISERESPNALKVMQYQEFFSLAGKHHLF